jgi:predicted glycoside hydrolase/deacetylase ChbG (UPF0249 family)
MSMHMHMLMRTGDRGNGGRLVLIVNADDYGLAPSVNRGIEQAHVEGIVTSTTVMANLPAAADAAGLAERCPELGVGLHLTLTHGAPSAPAASVRTLVDDDGRLLKRRILLARLQVGAIAADEVATECTAQLGALRRLGVEPDHWDVHHHLQEYAGLGAPIVAAMRGGGVLRARSPTRATAGLRSLRPAAALRARRREPAGRLIAGAFATPEALLEAPLPHWPRAIAGLRGGVIEAICHPAQASDELGHSALGSAERAAELAALCDPALRSRLDHPRVTWATFAAGLDR